MPIDFSAALSLLSNAQDRSESDTNDARAVIQTSLSPDSVSHSVRLAEVISFITNLETAKDFSALERTLRVLVEIGVAQTEISTTIERWRGCDELNLRSIADRITVQIKRASHYEHIEPAEVLQESEDLALPSIEETEIIKSLCGFCHGRSAANKFAFFRIYPQSFLNGKSRNFVIIAKDDCHSTVQKMLADMQFELCHSFKDALAIFEKGLLFNFVLMDFSLPRGEKISLEEYEARERAVDKMLMASQTAEYYRISITERVNFTQVEHDDRYYYYQELKIQRSEYIIAQLKGDLFKHVFQDAYVSQNDKVLISLFIPPDIRSVQYERIKKGFSGSRNYLITPIDEYGEFQKQSIIKIGDQSKLKQEEINYRTIIDAKIAHALKVSQIFFDNESIGALKYEFAHGSVKSGSRTLKQVYEMSTTEFDKRFSGFNKTKMAFLSWKIEYLFNEMLAKFNQLTGEPHQKLGREFIGYINDKDISENLELILPGVLESEKIHLYGQEFSNPRIFWLNTFKDHFKTCLVKNVHGDLHTDNMMIDDDGLIFLIDYGKTRKDGNVFTDYAMLEVSIKLDLISRNTPYTFILEFEKSLYSVPDLSTDLNYTGDYETLKNACALVNTVRKQANNLAQSIHRQNTMPNPFEHYLYALFPLTYAQLAFKDMNQQYALLSSALLADTLKPLLAE